MAARESGKHEQEPCIKITHYVSLRTAALTEQAAKFKRGEAV